MEEIINKTFSLDYVINEILDNHYTDDNGYKYDSLGWEIKVYTKSLLEEINDKFNMKLVLNGYNYISKEKAIDIYHSLQGRKDLTGTFGTRYLNPTL